MPTRGRPAPAPSARSVSEAPEARARKPRSRTTAATVRKAASKRSVVPPPEPPPETPPETLFDTERSLPPSARAILEVAEPLLPPEPLCAEPPPPIASVIVPVIAPVIAERAPALPEETTAAPDLAALRKELLAQAARDEAARASALAQALRLATAAAHHLDQVSREVGQIVAQVRGLGTHVTALEKKLNEREKEQRAARAEQARGHEVVSGQIAEIEKKLFSLTLRNNEEHAMSRKSSTELLHEVQRLVRAMSLPPR